MDRSQPTSSFEGIAEALSSRKRLEAVRRSGLLDSDGEKALDRLTRLAAATLSAPVAFISIVDEDRDFYKSEFGFPEYLRVVRELHGRTFCHFTLVSKSPLVIEDSLSSEVFSSVPTVQTMGVRAYIGSPIFSPHGENIGAFCALDTVPRKWSTSQIELLESFAATVSEHIALKAISQQLEETLAASRLAILERERALRSVVHDLRNPLNVISISAQAAQQSAGLPDRAIVLVDRIAKTSIAMAEMLSEILHRDSMVGQGFNPTGINLRKLIADAVSMFQPIAETSGMRIAADAHDPDAVVLVDYGQIIRVFSNLIGNSIKFGVPGSEVRITSRIIADMGHVSIQDEGCGIDPGDIPLVFDERWKKDSDETRGVGLGLFIARSIIRRHGGDMTVVPSVKGCRLEFMLPLARTS